MGIKILAGLILWLIATGFITLLIVSVNDQVETFRDFMVAFVGVNILVLISALALILLASIVPWCFKILFE